jgi:Xaa-Pro dipeptidase
VQKAIAAGQPLCGYEVDDATRAVIQKAGFGEYFHPPHRPLHRRGSARQRRQHGQFREPRRPPRQPFTCFSIEPGIYLPDFGVRNEINMYIGEGEAVVTGEVQRDMVLLA